MEEVGDCICSGDADGGGVDTCFLGESEELDCLFVKNSRCF